jgi:hypothetical protein
MSSSIVVLGKPNAEKISDAVAFRTTRNENARNIFESTSRKYDDVSRRFAGSLRNRFSERVQFGLEGRGPSSRHERKTRSKK